MKKTTYFILLLMLSVTSCKTSQPSMKGLTISPDSFNFLVVGDWGRDGDFGQTQVAKQMDKVGKILDPEFVISTGDNFYDAGVASIDDPIWQHSFEDVYRGGGLLKEWFVVLGNHDYKGNVQAQIDYSKKSRRWQMPDRYFTFARKIDKNASVRFVFIDTNPFIEKYQKEGNKYGDLALQNPKKQLQWLDSVLTKSQEKYKIVVGHHPVFSTGESHGDSHELIENLKPILDKHQVDFYFCGHDHDLQHQKPADSNTDYIVSGAGSEVRNGVSQESYTRFAESVPGFAAVALHSNSLQVQFINYKGKVIYSYQKSKHYVK